MDDTIRALNRFGLGARARERDSIAAPREWLRAQLDAFDPIPRDLPDLDESYAVFHGFADASQVEDEVRLKELRGRLGVIRAKGRPRHASNASDERHAIRRAARRVLVEPPVRLRGVEATGRGARARLRVLRGASPCAGSI